MAELIYMLGQQKTTGAAAGPVVTIVPAALAAGISVPELREIRVFNQSGVLAEVGMGIPALAGTGTITGGTVQPLNQNAPAGHTQVATSFGTTQPTAPAAFYDREELQAVAGAGVIFTFAPGEWPLYQNPSVPQVVLWQISALAVTYDVTVKVAHC